MKLIRSAFILVFLLVSHQLYSQVILPKFKADNIPPGFNCSSCILIVQLADTDNDKWHVNSKAEKNFQKHFSGKSVALTAKEVNENPKYSDKNIYRFVFVVESYPYDYQYSYNGMPRTATRLAMQFSLIDRLTNKGYGNVGGFNQTNKAFKSTIKTLNKYYKKG